MNTPAGSQLREAPHREAAQATQAAEASAGAIREYPGYEAVMEGGQVFKAATGLPLVTYGADEVLSRADSRHIFRDLTGEVLDWNLWCLSSAGVRLDLLIGEALLSLHGKLEKLGYVRVGDFAREELGLSSRSGYELMRNAKALQKLPLIREALEQGLLRKSALRHLFQVVTPETEAEWLSRAMHSTIREIEEEVKKFKSGAGEAGIDSFVAGDDDEEDAGSLAVTVGVPFSVAAKWDRAIEVFRRIEEAELPSDSFVEALLAEFVASAPLVGLGCPGTATQAPEDSDSGTGKPGAHHTGELSLCCAQEKGSQGIEASHGDCANHGEGAYSRNSLDASDTRENGADPAIEEKTLLLGALAGAIGSLDDEASFGERDKELARQVHKDLEEVSHLWEYLPWKPVTVELPKELQAPGGSAPPAADPFEALARLRSMVALRHSLSFYQGRLLRTLNNFGLYKDMLFLSLGHYTRERLGMSRSTAYSLISLERSYLEYPDMLDLVKVGKLTPEQARHLAKVFNEGTRVQGAWLDYAQEIPVATLIQAVEGFLRFAKRAVHKKWDIAPEAFEVAVTGRSVKRLPALASNATETNGDMGLDAGVQICAQQKTVEGGSCVPWGEPPAVIWEVTAGGEHPELPGILSILSGEHPKEGTFGSNPPDRGALIRFFLKRDLIPLWNHAVRLWGGEELALFVEALLDAFLAAWDHPEKKDLHSRVLARDHYQCQAPGCRCRRNLHGHHIRFRSHGGPTTEGNLITLCRAHHLRCLHEGHLVIRGKAPHGLTFIFPRGGRVR
ncbi:MAG: HNH endonuclease signature motif containing protein [Candidatus Eremiobacteraeota bacterium]|nr:HNH endonuclease signature motif containing protein [Candidatus Eremiobacteraeota bacterium]